MNLSKIVFVYADPPGFSGQRNAVRIIMEGCHERGIVCESVTTPTANRLGEAKATWIFQFIGAFFITLGRALKLRAAGEFPVYLTFGQTYIGLIRDGVPFAALTVFRKKRSIVSFHGSNFTRWKKDSLKVYMLRALLSQAKLVTVLGHSQRQALQNLSIPAEKIKVVPNTCQLDVLSEVAVQEKQTIQEAEPLKILYLSSLIKSKGYPSFLEAIEQLAAQDGRVLEVVLCGSIIISEYDDFPSVEFATDWIESKLQAINESKRVKIRWIKGAYGEEKSVLFRDAHLFVFPTEYPVEAQPLVLLEAMATGNAIVTSRIGEIPTILDDKIAVLLEDVSANAVARAIVNLEKDELMRIEFAQSCKKRFEEEFSLQPHLNLWYEMFTEVA